MACKITDPMECHYFGCLLAQEGYCERMKKLINQGKTRLPPNVEGRKDSTGDCDNGKDTLP